MYKPLGFLGKKLRSTELEVNNDAIITDINKLPETMYVQSQVKRLSSDSEHTCKNVYMHFM